MSAGLRTQIGQLAHRSVLRTLRQPAQIVPALIFPLFLLAVNAGGLKDTTNLPGFPTDSYLTFALAVPFMQGALFSVMNAGTDLARDFETGFANRYLLAASNRNGIVLGYAMAALVRAVITWAILTAVALVAGMEVGGGGVELFGLYGLAVLVNLAATMWAAGVAMRVRSIQGGPLMQFPVFLVLFLPPVYVPIELLSGWIHTVASVNPVTALLEAGRGFISGDPVLVGLAFTVAVALPVLFALWARGGLRRAEAAG